MILGANSVTRVTESAAPTGAWCKATVREIVHPSPHAVILRVEVANRINHLPGQHYVIRLSADDGYVAQRSYSIASAPADPLLEFYIERLDEGEVSSFLADVVEVGDELDLRGPIGGWFVWRADTPALCLGGGSGAVPFAAMVRHARDVGRVDLLRIALSARTHDDVPYLEEFRSAGAFVALTRERAEGRLASTEIAPLLPPDGPCFVCGSAAFAEGATDLLMDLQVATPRIKVERFGPSG